MIQGDWKMLWDILFRQSRTLEAISDRISKCFLEDSAESVEGLVKPHSHLMLDLHRSCLDSATAEETRES